MSRFYRAYLSGSEDGCPRNTREQCVMGQAEENTAANPCGLALAMAYVPNQKFENLYAPMEGWRRGTLWADLDKPYEGGCCK